MKASTMKKIAKMYAVEVTKKHPTEISEYIRRNKHGKTHKVGVVLGTLSGDTVRVGWSKCNAKAGDKFEPKIGLELARNRALIKVSNVTPIPDCIRKQVRQFGARCCRYFKSANKIELPA